METFWPEQDVPPSKHVGSEPRGFMRTRTKEHMIVPNLTIQKTKKVDSMTETTEGSRLELNKTDEQNKTHVANIFEDKDIEKRKDMPVNQTLLPQSYNSIIPPMTWRPSGAPMPP